MQVGLVCAGHEGLVLAQAHLPVLLQRGHGLGLRRHLPPAGLLGGCRGPPLLQNIRAKVIDGLRVSEPGEVL